ncbi:sulfatase [Haloarcula rubripromontorii]|uniref:Sulfatase-like hydrolase/transferase n=1 Tax=Haloarcula rubripromontorii TaxID=1705562 RepID=A0A847U2H7_9EURY|nr:sulfatase [Haloarcula rubripromontorii]NLV06896.1 sulfatase-like hydrolase/transferase [Haloarcula rubripromontorii]
MSPPNIVWITLDSVRADHTTLDGYGRDTTPTLSRLGDSGHAFTNCISHSKSTLPSSGAILTGYAPSKNTLGISGNVLPDTVPTIAERFGNLGYQTACLSRNSYVSNATGLDRGFDRFQWLSSSTIHQAGPSTLLRYLLNIKKHSAGLTTDTAKHASPFLMNDMAKGWLDDFSNESDPFFFYLHYNEPHRPYYPPLSHMDQYTDGFSQSPKNAAEFSLDLHYNLKKTIADGCDLTEDEWEMVRAMYDSEISYTDKMVGRLVDYIQSLPLGETIIVITADHGELFGEYGLLSHNFVLHDAVTRVPLVINGLDQELIVDNDELIQHSDVMATLLSMAGGEISDLVGLDLRTDHREIAVSQREPMTYDEILSYNPDFDTSQFHTGTLTALRTDEFKYLHGDDRDSLFKLPDEETDARDQYTDVYEDLSTEYDTWLENYGEPVTKGEKEQFSGAVQKQLRDLGYME